MRGRGGEIVGWTQYLLPIVFLGLIVWAHYILFIGDDRMVGQQLGEKIAYAGMERDLRRLAINDKLASVEEIACMTRWEICDLVAKKYEMVFAESEKVGLVKIEDMDTYKKIVRVLAR